MLQLFRFEPSVASSDPRTDFYQSSFLLISLDELGRRAQYYSASIVTAFLLLKTGPLG